MIITIHTVITCDVTDTVTITGKLREVPSKAGSHVIYTVYRYRKMFTASFCKQLLVLVTVYWLLYTVTARARTRGGGLII